MSTINMFHAHIVDYLARAVSSREPGLGKAVVSDFVQTLSAVCPDLQSCITPFLLQ